MNYNEFTAFADPTPAMLLGLILSAVLIVAMWKIFEKAGQPGWASIVPIYNYIILIKMAEKPMYYLILLFIPLVNIAIIIIVYSEILNRFQKPSSHIVLLLLFTPIYLCYLGFSDCEYIRDQVLDNPNY